MNHRSAWRIGRVFFSLILLITLGATPRVTVKAQDPPDDIPTVDPLLLSEAKRSDSLEYLIYFEEQADLSAAYTLSWEARGWYVYETLNALAEESQAEVRAFLDKEGVPYQSFWVQNVIAVENSNWATLDGLLNYWEIDSLRSIPQVFLDDAVTNEVETETAQTRAVSSNLTHIKVNEVWVQGHTGAGMVVGSIDTGVRYTHEALINQYRGNLGGDNFDHNYNWWDAVNGTDVADDDHWHGTHTTGIMVGDDGAGNQIGVAPGAEWIACKGLPASGYGSGSDLLECGQFMVAPWDLNGLNDNPDLRPHVVNNSWGDCDQVYDAWYEGTIDSWLAAGIYPIFANGNAGNCGYSSPPGLNTVGNPARSYHVTGVGSTGHSDGEYANHSNWGPTDDPDTINPNGYPNLKPQVVAPGVYIRSAVVSGESNSTYGMADGTSMAAPHVAGLIALMWQSAPCLLGDYVQTETLIQNTAVPIPYATGNGDEGPANIPNHATGWGEIDALAAVEAAISMCGGANIIGKVFDTFTRLPINNAVVISEAAGSSDNNRSSPTYRSGFYIQTVVPGETYTISTDVAGYLPSDPFTNVKIDSVDTVITATFYLEREGLSYNYFPLFLK